MKGKRRSILRSAEHEFLEKGYEGTSIDAIVKDVGGSKSTIYAYFRDKEVLFAETVANTRRELDFSLPQSAPEEGDDPRAGLARLGIELLSTLYSERALHLFRTVIAESQRFPDVARQLLDEGLAVAVERIAAFIEHEVTDGRLAPCDARVAANTFVALLRADTHLRLLLGTDPTPDAAAIAAAAERAATDLLAIYPRA